MGAGPQGPWRCAPTIYFSIILGAVQWQPDAKQAMRFARKEDALNMKRAYVMESAPEELALVSQS